MDALGSLFANWWAYVLLAVLYRVGLALVVKLWNDITGSL